MLRCIVAIYLIANVHSWIVVNIQHSLLMKSLSHRRFQQSIIFHGKQSDDDDTFDYTSSDEEESSTTNESTDQQNSTSIAFQQEECWDLCPTMDDEENEVLPQDLSKSRSELTVLSSAPERDIQIERDRIRLEMAYRLFESRDDCDLDDISTCASPCQECHGVGSKPCRFCAGTKSIQLLGATSSLPCPVCNQKGVEVCTHCRGSGKVASWTDLAKFNPEKAW
jgi:DnaJ-class molecular chaperone